MKEYVVLIALASVCNAAVLPDKIEPSNFTKVSGCVHDGKIYEEGDKVPGHPCMPCFCSNGGAMACMVIDCMRPNCVDAVKGKDDCCAVCPNGPNCRLPDGTILEGSLPKRLEDGRECKCSPIFGMGFTAGNMNATCVQTTKIDIRD